RILLQMKIRRFVRIIALIVIIAVAVSVYLYEKNAIEREDRDDYVQSSVSGDEGKIKVVISAVGDIVLGQDSRFSYRDSFDYVFDKTGGDYGYFFANAVQILEQDDITIA